jgi:hypothetical protein
LSELAVHHNGRAVRERKDYPLETDVGGPPADQVERIGMREVLPGEARSVRRLNA